jgi:Cu/Ag efflux protein CusF
MHRSFDAQTPRLRMTTPRRPESQGPPAPNGQLLPRRVKLSGVINRTPYLFAIILALAALSSSCHHTQTAQLSAEKRYAFTGRIISIDTKSESAFIYGDDIPGYMDSMGMSYKIKPAADLAQLTPGDIISAGLVVIEPNPKDENAEAVYWLENIKVTGHKNPAPKPTMWRGRPRPRPTIATNAYAIVEEPRFSAAKGWGDYCKQAAKRRNNAAHSLP